MELENNIIKQKNVYVVTIAIQMHGIIINFDLDPTEASAFDNVRLLCKAGGFNSIYRTSPYVANDLRKIFGKDMVDRSTYDIISQRKSGLLLDTISYDKALFKKEHDDSWNPFDMLNGIYLITIHKDNVLMYPSSPTQKVINLLKVEDLHELSSMFDSAVPDLASLSKPFPVQTIFVEEEREVRLNTSLTERDRERRIKELRGQFMRLLGDWKLTMNRDGAIDHIKLSYLVKMVKDIMNVEDKDTTVIINLLDYSCNEPTSYIPEETQHLSKYVFQDVENDYDALERGQMGHRSYGGARRRRRSRKKRTKKRKNRRRSLRL
jgi:hypothetical protein